MKNETDEQNDLVPLSGVTLGQIAKTINRRSKDCTPNQRKDVESDRTDNRQRGVTVRSNTGYYTRSRKWLAEPEVLTVPYGRT
jgi:hypothetical protein